jgi:hypothetical protein
MAAPTARPGGGRARWVGRARRRPVAGRLRAASSGRGQQQHRKRERTPRSSHRVPHPATLLARGGNCTRRPPIPESAFPNPRSSPRPRRGCRDPTGALASKAGSYQKTLVATSCHLCEQPGACQAHKIRPTGLLRSWRTCRGGGQAAGGRPAARRAGGRGDRSTTRRLPTDVVAWPTLVQRHAPATSHLLPSAGRAGRSTGRPS